MTISSSGRLLGQAELLRLQRGVEEGRDDDEPVAIPLCGLAELDVERLSRRRDPGTVRQYHLPGKASRGTGDHRDPVAAAELGRVWSVYVDVLENQHKL